MDPHLHKLVCDALFVHNLDRLDRVRDPIKQLFVRLERRIAQRHLLITSAHLFRHQVGHEDYFAYHNGVKVISQNIFRILIKTTKTNDRADLEFVFDETKKFSL